MRVTTWRHRVPTYSTRLSDMAIHVASNHQQAAVDAMTLLPKIPPLQRMSVPVIRTGVHPPSVQWYQDMCDLRQRAKIAFYRRVFDMPVAR